MGRGVQSGPVKWLSAVAWTALGYNILVILWGAYVRISGSGAGCGDHWPLCNGEVVPRSFTLERIVEFSHRGSSSISGLLSILVLALAFTLTKRGHPVRLGAAWSLGLILFEGVIGGAQVLLGLTANSTDPARGFVQGLHLANTFALLGAFLLTALWAGGAPRPSFKGQGWLQWAVPTGAALMLVLGMAGAVTALGDKLFVPAPGTPLDTVKADFGATASLIENLRVIHPALALIVCAYLVWFAARVLREAGYTGELRAVGDVLVDQLAYMRRCGFDAFAPEVPLDPADAQAAFDRFPEVYQPTVDGRLPIWDLRHAGGRHG